MNNGLLKIITTKTQRHREEKTKNLTTNKTNTTNKRKLNHYHLYISPLFLFVVFVLFVVKFFVFSSRCLCVSVVKILSPRQKQRLQMAVI